MKAKAGDIVRWDSMLWRVNDVYAAGGGKWAYIVNAYGDDNVPLKDLERIGIDTLTDTGRSRCGSVVVPPYQRRSSTPTPPKPKGKVDSLSTASLISDEVKRLKSEPSETECPKMKKRDGEDW